MEFDLDLLLSTYSDLLVGPYKLALQQVLESGMSDLAPPKLDDLSDISPEEAIRHIQECSVHYSKVSTLAAFAKSAARIAEGKYKQAFKERLGSAPGSNADAREAHAATETEALHQQALFYDSANNFFSSLESQARVAADSSRKTAELVHSQRITESGSHY